MRSGPTGRKTTLARYSTSHTPTINPIIYAEVSIGFARIEDREAALAGCGIQILAIPKEALFSGRESVSHVQKKRRNKATLPCPTFSSVRMRR